MKKILFSVLIFLFSSYLYAGVPHKVSGAFHAGNKLYEQGKYKESIKKYNSIIKQGYISDAIYYNLGNCYFKLGLLGKTILYYERAKRLNPRNPELISNLNYVHSLLEDKIKPLKRNWISKECNSIAHFMPIGKWVGLTAIIWLVFSGLGILAIFLANFRKILIYIDIGLIVFLAMGTAIIFILHTESKNSQAIVLSKKVTARYGPGEGEVEAFFLHEGTKVSVKSSEGSWVHIQLQDGKAGWLPKKAVEKI